LRERKVTEEIPRGNETVLVVEDNETVRMLAARILKRQGYEVLQAADGEEAVLLCKDRRDPFRWCSPSASRHGGRSAYAVRADLHLVLTDVVMPRMSGPKLVERLRQVCQGLKVLYMSGYTDDTIVHQGVLEGRIDYIQKPFTLENLSRRVREVLDR